MADVFIALGSNLGDRVANLAAARAMLGRAFDISAVSSVYETDPWGPIKQGRYLNQVVRASAAFAPQTLLEKLMDIERELGRDRRHEERYGPRMIDLDILLYGDLAVREPDLEIPHPRMMERAFVLVPLLEIAPDLAVHGVPAREALARLDRTGVARFKAPA
jgi:2-amino-4-hydroxy-6-hydroxymethyldihydropteridine diphosphokinase